MTGIVAEGRGEGKYVTYVCGDIHTGFTSVIEFKICNVDRCLILYLISH